MSDGARSFAPPGTSSEAAGDTQQPPPQVPTGGGVGGCPKGPTKGPKGPTGSPPTPSPGSPCSPGSPMMPLRQWLLGVGAIGERHVDRLLAVLGEEEVDSADDLLVLASRVGGAFDVRLSELAAAKIRGALGLDTWASAATRTPRTPDALAVAVARHRSPAEYGGFPLDKYSWDKSEWHRDLFTQRLNTVTARVDPGRTLDALALTRHRSLPSSPTEYGGPLETFPWDKSEWHRDLFAQRLGEVAARDCRDLTRKGGSL